MRISLRVDSTSYHLAGQSGVSEREHSSASEIRINPAAASQTIQRVRASAAAVLDRGNLLTTISFTTTRKFATPALAEQYALDYDRTVPRSGILWLDTVGTDGSTIVRRFMAGAVVDPPARSVTGCTVFLSYTVRGGAITTT